MSSKSVIGCSSLPTPSTPGSSSWSQSYSGQHSPSGGCLAVQVLPGDDDGGGGGGGGDGFDCELVMVVMMMVVMVMVGIICPTRTICKMTTRLTAEPREPHCKFCTENTLEPGHSQCSRINVFSSGIASRRLY